MCRVVWWWWKGKRMTRCKGKDWMAEKGTARVEGKGETLRYFVRYFKRRGRNDSCRERAVYESQIQQMGKAGTDTVAAAGREP